MLKTVEEAYYLAICTMHELMAVMVHIVVFAALISGVLPNVRFS